MQLVAYGAQDVYLSGNPQITFFKVVYRRHTSFAMESIEQVFNGAADFGRKVTANISRNGDLIHKSYVRVELPAVTVPVNTAFRWLDWVGHILIKSVEIEIGGQRIDKHYGDWMHIWNELTQTPGHALGYSTMVGNTPQLTQVHDNCAYPDATPAVIPTGPITVPGKTLWIPLEFWWCRNPGLALPLIALQYHEVKVNIEFSDAKSCYWAGTKPADVGAAQFTPNLAAITTPSLASASLFVDYIYLDTDERRRFAQAAHEYLVEQLQFTGDESTSQVYNKIKLNFNHPCKEVIWVVQPDDNVSDSVANDHYGKQWFNYTDKFEQKFGTIFPDALQMDGIAGLANGGTNSTLMACVVTGGENPVASAKLQLNGHDRLSERGGEYWNLVMPYQHHENVPSRGINVYSFALKPEEHQPSGTCNMSRIDNVTLNLTLTNHTVSDLSGAGSRSAKIRVYAVNYNVLRIMSGMGGLAYSD